MATTTTLTSEQILKQLSENTDLKSLAAVLEKLQLFKPNKNKNKNKNVDLNQLPPKSFKPKLIGKKSSVSTASSSSSLELVKKNSSEKIDSDSGKSGTSGSSRKRGSRGSRRGRRRRLRRQKQLQTERAAQLLAKMVGSQTVPPVQQTLSPPQQFFKYPRILPARDVLHDPMTGEDRPVWSVTIPMVCHKTNTPFYAQCSTARHGYCSRCGVLRKGCKQIGSCCSQQGCGERLTAKYHRWYPGLIRLEPYGKKERQVSDYEKNKNLFKKFNISWNNEDELNFVVENYLLMKVFLVSPDFDVAPLHVERAYMIGVFAGRKFHTGALARKFLRDGLRLMSFRADFPKSMKAMPDERAQVVEEMNQIFFQGRFRCYFHGHQSNIEGWYDPTQVDPATVHNYLKAVCQRYGKNETSEGRQPTSVPQSRFRYPKNPSRFAFAHQQKQQQQKAKTPITSSDESEDSSSVSHETPRASFHYQQQAPPTVSYVPVYVSGGQQYMTVPMAPQGAMTLPYGMQPYGMQPAPYGMQPVTRAVSAPSSETSSVTSEVYSQSSGPSYHPTPSYHPQAQFVPFQPIYS